MSHLSISDLQGQIALYEHQAAYCRQMLALVPDHELDQVVRFRRDLRSVTVDIVDAQVDITYLQREADAARDLYGIC